MGGYGGQGSGVRGQEAQSSGENFKLSSRGSSLQGRDRERERSKGLFTGSRSRLGVNVPSDLKF